MSKIILTDNINAAVVGGSTFADAIANEYGNALTERAAELNLPTNTNPVKVALVDAGIFGNSHVKDLMQTEQGNNLFPAFIEYKLSTMLDRTDIMSYICSKQNEHYVPSSFVKSVTLDLLSAGNKPNVRKKRVSEGAELPLANIVTGNGGVDLYAKGRALSVSYEAMLQWRIDLFARAIEAIARDIALQNVEDATDVLLNGDGNGNSAETLLASTATANTITADELLSACIDYALKYKCAPTTILAPKEFATSLAKVTYSVTQNAGASSRLLLSFPQLANMNLNVISADVPKTGAKNQAIVFNSDLSLSRYILAGSQIIEEDKRISSRTKVVAISEVSAYSRFMDGTVGTIISA